MTAMIDGYVLLQMAEDGEMVFYSVDESADIDSIFVSADFKTPLKVYLTKEEADGALYEASFLYQRNGLSTELIDNTTVVPYTDYYDEIEQRCLEVEVA